MVFLTQVNHWKFTIWSNITKKFLICGRWVAFWRWQNMYNISHLWALIANRVYQNMVQRPQMEEFSHGINSNHEFPLPHLCEKQHLKFHFHPKISCFLQYFFTTYPCANARKFPFLKNEIFLSKNSEIVSFLDSFGAHSRARRPLHDRHFHTPFFWIPFFERFPELEC